jgi:hypothetical protein
MTDPTGQTTPPERASLWEDFLEIFINPAAVFERRKTSGFWLPLLVVTVAIAALYLAFKGAMQPIMDAEYNRAIARVMEQNPELAPEQLASGKAFQERFTSIMIVLGVPVAILLVGLVLWTAGKVVGAVQTVGAACMVAAYSFSPRIVEQLVDAAQALFLPEEQLTGRGAISIGPARFLDPNTASPILSALLLRADVFTLWITVLLAIGLRVTGKVPMSKALIAAAIVWFVGGLPSLLGAMRMAG